LPPHPGEMLTAGKSSTHIKPGTLGVGFKVGPATTRQIDSVDPHSGLGLRARTGSAAASYIPTQRIVFADSWPFPSLVAPFARTMYAASVLRPFWPGALA